MTTFNSPAYRRLQAAAEITQSSRGAQLHVFFWARKLKNQYTINVRLTYNGKRLQGRSTGIVATPERFDNKTLTITGDPVNSARLRTLEATIQQVFKDRELTGRSLETKVILDIAFGLRDHDEALPTVLEALQLQLERVKSRCERGDLRAGSLSRYKTYTDILTRFFTLHPGYGKRMGFNELKPALAQHLIDDYLKCQKGYCHNYSLKIFQFMRALIEWAVAEGWADRNPVRHIRLRKYHKPPVNLTLADLDKLKHFSFVEIHANQVRDVFLFCCYTGLAYSDVAKLRPAHLMEVQGVPCIVQERTKSGQQAFVPLFPDAQAILDRYRMHEGCRMKGVLLPTLSNQKMNNWLKIIGNTVGIALRLHTHLARKTFTLYSEEMGFTLTEMAVMLGHTNLTMTEKHYYQRRREPVIVRFKSLFPHSDQQQAS